MTSGKPGLSADADKSHSLAASTNISVNARPNPAEFKGMESYGPGVAKTDPIGDFGQDDSTDLLSEHSADCNTDHSKALTPPGSLGPGIVKPSLKQTLGVIGVLIERNFKLMTRFSVSHFMFYVGVLSDAALSAFLGKALVGGQQSAQIGGDYISYVIIGLAYSQLMSTSIRAPMQSLSGAYWSARLEPLLRAPVRLEVVILADSLWYYMIDAVTIFIYVLVGAAFGMKIQGGPALPAGLLALMAGCISVLGYGFISAAMFNLINAKGFNEPVEWLVSTMQRLVCGVYFPTSVLPNWLKVLGGLMPQTYVLDYVRRVFIPTYPKGPTLPAHILVEGLRPETMDLLVVAALTLVVLPLGLWAFNKGMQKARQDGGLSRWN